MSLQGTGQPKLRLQAQSPTEFFLQDVEAALTFTKDASRQVTGLELQQNGRDVPGRRRAAVSAWAAA